MKAGAKKWNGAKWGAEKRKGGQEKRKVRGEKRHGRARPASRQLKIPKRQISKDTAHPRKGGRRRPKHFRALVRFALRNVLIIHPGHIHAIDAREGRVEHGCLKDGVAKLSAAAVKSYGRARREKGGEKKREEGEGI